MNVRDSNCYQGGFDERQSTKKARLVLVITGASGAVDTTNSIIPYGFTIAKNATMGQYDIMFPSSQDVRVHAFIAGSTTLISLRGTASPVSNTNDAGSWSFLCFGQDGATQALIGAWPASGDEIDIFFDFDTEPVV